MREVKREIATLVRTTGSQLTGIHGAAAIVAGTILGQVGDVRRYPTRHHFATANGTAPLPASSGRIVRHRLSRGGNRQFLPTKCLAGGACTPYGVRAAPPSFACDVLGLG